MHDGQKVDIRQTQRDLGRFLYLFSLTSLKSKGAVDPERDITLAAYHILSQAQQCGLEWPDFTVIYLEQIRRKALENDFVMCRRDDSCTIFEITKNSWNGKHLQKVLKHFEEEYPTDAEAIKKAVEKYVAEKRN